MSSFKDSMNEKAPAAFRERVMAEAQTELKAIRKRKALRGFWSLAFGSAFSFGIVSWFTQNLLRNNESPAEFLADLDHELLEDIDVLEDLEFLEELEKEGIEI